MKEIFTRIEDEQEVHIEIETAAYAYSEKLAWLYSIFIKFDSLDETNDSFEEFLETKESIILALEHENRAKYVGMRIVDGWSELYFYAGDSKNLDPIVSKMLKGLGYTYETSVVKDTKWDFHYKNLLPTARELAHIQSQKIIFLLEEEGDDISVAREVEHYVSFEMPTQKARFMNTMSLEGFEFKDEVASEEFENGVALVKKHSVEETRVRETVNELFDALSEYKGFYEGWSTLLVSEVEEDG